MRTRYMMRAFALILCISIFSQCKMHNVSMTVTRPAEITFPSSVKTLLLLDRTKFKSNATNIIEGVLTGELPGEDKAGLQEAMRTFQSTIMVSPRFQVIKATEILEGNSITSAFPAPLPWSQVEELCKKYNADAVVAFEIFDTDFIVTNGQRMVKKKVEQNGVQQEIEVPEYWAQGVGNATVGIRLYDPRTKSIVDEDHFSRSNTWQATGSSIADAVAHLIIKQEATKYIAGVAGTDYAYKIAPMPVRISREYYAKGKKAPQVAAGSRRADVNDWKGAIETWQAALNGASAKDAGRLCYDIAIAYEVLGDLESAKKWASRAWIDYGNKRGRAYVSLIEDRMRQEEVVKQQMK